MELPYSDTNAGLHYDLHLNLDPQTQFISVTGSVAYHAPQPRLERARFFLHRQFTIQRLEGRRVLGYQFDNTSDTGLLTMPHASVLDVYFDPPLDDGETALIQFEYSGFINDLPPDSANLISPEWTEISLILPWFPYQHSSQTASLTFTLQVTCPSEYQVGSYGLPDFQNGSWYFNWMYPTNDIVVVAGRTLEPRRYASEPNHLIFHSATFSEASATRLGEDVLSTLERFSGWFGPTRPSDFTLIESPRPLGGGYARRGLVVISDLNERDYLDQREAYLRYLAHEAAHAWWWQAPSETWEDWLNESFAEYAALLAVRERFGEEIFDRFLERKRERDPGEIALWGFERSDGSTPEKKFTTERMLFDKGPLLLHGLAERIGYKRFFEFCRAMLWSGVTDSTHLLDLLEEIEDPQTRVWFERALKS